MGKVYAEKTVQLQILFKEKEMRIQIVESQSHPGSCPGHRINHLICLLRNLYAGQVAIVRTGHGTGQTGSK